MDENMEWLEKLPVMSYPVSIGAFEELMNHLYNYSRRNYRKAVDDRLIITILYSLGYVTSTRYIEAEVTPEGEKYLEKVDGQLLANEQGQAFLKDHLLTNGLGFPEAKRGNELLPFTITEEQAEKYVFSEEPLSLLQILHRINALIDTSRYRKLTSNALADFLVDEGMLAVIPVEGGRFYRRATKKGNKEGIFYRDRLAGDGNTYLVNLYDKNAQFFIIDNLETIMLFARGEKKVRESRLNEVFDGTPEAEEGVKYTCKDCMDYRNGNCFTANKICEDFRYAPTFTRKETENWPKEGDASYFRRKGKW